MRRRPFLASAGLLVGALAGCVGDLDTATETHTLTGLTSERRLAVLNRNGDVTVEPSEQPEPTISLTKRTRRGVDLSRVSINRQVTDGRLEITPSLPTSVAPGDVSIDMVFAVPRNSQLAAVETDNGAVTVTGGRGDVTARSTNGSVTVQNVDGYVSAATSNGDVRVRNTTGIDEVRSINGSVNGDVAAIRQDVVIETTNGDIAIALAPTLNARLEASTVTGSVTVRDVPLGDTTNGEKHASGTLGAGDGTVTVQTTNGSITLTELK